MAATSLEIHADLSPALRHIDQFFGVWAIEEMRFAAMLDQVRRMDWPLHMAAAQPRRASEEMNFDMTDDGVAVIRLQGAMSKYGSSLDEASGTVAIRRQIKNAARNPAVRSIVLQIDSPGGTVAGTRELAEAVAGAARKKPTLAYIEDLGASAAYWVASQAGRVYLNETGLAGSIGTFSVICDYSEMARNEGIKVHVLRAGDFKGAATPGTEVSESQLAEFQRIVDELNAHFMDGVAAGRRMSAEAVKGLADGRVHVGRGAVKLGLADGVKTFEEVLEEAARANARWLRKDGAASAEIEESEIQAAAAADTSTDEREDGSMSEPTQQAAASTQPQAATYAELKAGLIGADAGFICAQLEAGATLAQAQAAWMSEQNRRIEEARAERPGVQALTSQTKAKAESGDPQAAWEAAIKAKVATGLSRARAIASVVREDPDLHAAYLEAVNASRK